MHAATTLAEATPARNGELVDAREIVSPELVLVDPVLRERALRALPDRDPLWLEPTRPAATDAIPAPRPAGPKRGRQRIRAYVVRAPIVVLAFLVGPKLWKGSSTPSRNRTVEGRRHASAKPTRTLPAKRKAAPARKAST